MGTVGPAGAAPAMPGAIAAICAVACAAATFHQDFPWSDLLAPLAIAAVLPLILVATTRGRPAWQSLAACATAWVLTVSPVVFHRVPGPTVFTDSARGLRDGWHVILTTVLPLPRHPELLIVAYTAIWIAATATAELAARTRASAAPALPSILLLGLANLLGAGGPDGSESLVLIATGTTAAALAATAVRAVPRRGPGPATRRRARPASVPSIRGLAAVGVIAVVALAAAPRLPLIAHAVPFDPRRDVSQPPPALQRAVSPLDEANAWLAEPVRELFTVRAVSGAPWRLAVFDHFDGALWTSPARWQPTGGRVPDRATMGSASSAAEGPPLDQTVTISGLTGPWLPAAERPTQVSGLDVAVDPASGVIAADRPPARGQTYVVRSVPAAPDPARLAAAAVAHDAEAQAALQLPATDSTGQTLVAYQDLLARAGTATAGATSPFQQASMLAHYLSVEERFDASATAGYSYRSLQDFVDTTHRGTSVQSAAAFVVMARTLGLPSRIAVGFRPGTARGGVWQVTTADIMAWPEVDFAGAGWVPFWPTPAGAGAAAPAPALPTGPANDPAKPSQGSTAATPPPSSATGAAPSAAGGVPDSTGTSAALSSGGVLWTMVGALALGVFVLYLTTVPAAPARRRRRRARAKDPAERVRGAWIQAIEGLPDAAPVRDERRRISPLTTAELARAAESSLGPAAGPHVSALAALVDAAVYAAAGADHAAADAAWRHCSTLEDLTARRLGWRRRCARRLTGRT